MKMKPDKKAVLGIAIVSIFLFAIFAISSYKKAQGTPEFRIDCPVYTGTISVFDVLPMLATLGVVVGAGTYYLMSQQIETKQDSIKKDTRIILKLLSEDERKAISKLVDGGGKTLQAEISRLPGLSKVKSHRIVRRLEKRGVITVESYGKTNIIQLVKEIKEGLL